MNRPVIDSTWTRVITNYAELSLRDTSNEADGYFFVAAESTKGTGKRKLYRTGEGRKI